MFELILQTFIKYEKYQKDQQTIQSYNKIYGKSSQDNLIDRIANQLLCNIFTKYLAETKNEYFL